MAGTISGPLFFSNMKTFENTFNAKFNKADKVQKRGFKSGLPISKARPGL